MMIQRYPAVSGRFYPEDPRQLQAVVIQLLHSARRYALPPVRALICPHAGYIYSGPVAASAYIQLENQSNLINRVILLGPSHRFAFQGVALSPADAYLSPLGPIPLAKAEIQNLADSGLATFSDIAHKDEHSLEVQLPFLQCCLNEFILIPLVVGDASAQEVARILTKLKPDEHSLVVVSTDLSHYHPYAEAQKRDAQSSKYITDFNYAELTYDSACGRMPLSGLLLYAKKQNWHIMPLDLRNSGDTAGDKQRVVGYGAYALH